MENFIPESPKIKYIIPKEKPSVFSLNEGQLDMTDSDEKNEFNYFDGSDKESNNNEYKSDFIKVKSLDDLNENSIFKTLVYLKKKKESISSIATQDSF